MDNLTAVNASDYDRSVRETIPFYEILHNEVIQLVKALRPDVSVWVDTGCGTAYLVAQASAVFPRTRFILADPAKAMLVQARNRLASLPSEQLTILPPADSAGLEAHLSPVSTDVITAIQCHHYLQPDGRRNAVKACFNLLAPGGLFVGFENVAAGTAEGTKLGLKRWKTFQVAQGKSEQEADKHLSRYGTQFFPIPVKDHLNLLKEVGFQVVELFWFSHMQAGFYAIK